MLKDIQIYSKITAKSFLRWLLIVGFGILFSLIFFVIVLIENWHPVGKRGYILNLLTTDWAGFLLIFGLPLFIILYVLVANQYATQTVIFLIWKNKVEEFASEKIKALVEKIMSKSQAAHSITNESILKLKLLEANRTHPDSSKIKRKAVDYIIKKINLDDIDFGNNELSFGDIVATKVNNFISGTAEPSLRLFWILAAIQFLLFIISQFL